MKNKCKKRQRLAAFIMAAILVVSLCPVINAPAEAANTVVYNGNEIAPFNSRTKEEIGKHYSDAFYANNVYLDGDAETYYSTPASTEAPYNPGVLKPETHEIMTAVSNYYRWLVGAEPLRTGSSHSDDMQAGALVRCFQCDHLVSSSSKPDDMPDELWEQGASAYHNILAPLTTPRESITRWLNEGYNLSNGWDDQHMGHRLSIIGARTAGLTYGFSGGTCIGKVTAYGNINRLPFIAFPAPGYMPYEHLSPYNSAWDIQVNSSYMTYSLDEITIRVTDLKTGTSYDCTVDNGKLEAGSHGSTVSIAFVQPEPTNRNSYSDGDSFKVQVTGLKDVASGGSAKIEYTVNMIDLREYTDTAVTSVNAGRMSNLMLAPDYVNDEYLNEVAEALPRTLYLRTDNDRDVSVQAAGSWQYDADSDTFVNTVDLSSVPSYVHDPAGILNKTVSIPYSAKNTYLNYDDITFYPTYPNEGDSGTLTVSRHILPFYRVYVYQLVDGVPVLRFSTDEDEYTISGSQKTETEFTIDSFSRSDSGKYIAFYGDESYNTGTYFVVPFTTLKVYHTPTPLSISAQPQNASAVLNGIAEFTVKAAGDGLTYQWQFSKDGGKSWKDSTSAGYNTKTVKVTAMAKLDGYLYRCAVTDENGETMTSDAAKLTVFMVTTQPKDVTVPLNGTAKFSVSANGSGLTYQWQLSADGGKNWSNSTAAGYNTASIKIKAEAKRDGFMYRCVVQDSNGNTVTSEAAKLTVFRVTEQPENASAILNSTAKFTVNVPGDGLTYQWQYSANSGKSWSNISNNTAGYNTASLSVTATAKCDGYLYRCVITNSSGNTVTSDSAKLTLVKITSQPVNVTAELNSTVKFTVSVTGSNLTYQWQLSSDGKSWSNSTASGYKTATLTVSAEAERDGLMYRCVVKDSAGSTLTSDAAKLTVYGITAQPKDVSTKLNSTATFTVAAKGEGLTYQWQLSASSGKSWSNSTATGYKTATMKVKAEAKRDGYMYRCVVKDSQGHEMISNAAKLTVYTSAAITSQPSDVIGVLNSTVKFTVGATGDGLTYQWQLSADGGKNWSNSTASGYKTATMKVKAEAKRDGYMYRCVVKDSQGNTATSDGAKLTVFGITTQPKNVQAKLDSTAKFTVAAKGAGLTYQWQLSANGGSSWSNSTASGYNTATIKVKAEAKRDGYMYRCIVKDSSGNEMTSNAAKLTVFRIVTQPKNTEAARDGDTVTVTVKASGEGLTYQWYYKDKNQTAFTKTTVSTPSYSVKVTSAVNGRQVYCVVTDKNGSSITSNTVTLTISKDAPIAYGKCGDNAEWELKKDGTLKIIGTGKVYHWNTSTPAPWDEYKDQILKAEIGDGITWLESYMFYNCSKLTSVTISDTVTTINGYAFNACASLERIELPASVSSIKSYAFYECPKLSFISVDKANKNYLNDTYGVVYSKDKTVLVVAPPTLSGKYTVTSTVKTIAASAFRGCASLTEISLPSGLTALGERTFFGCSSLASIVIPSGVTALPLGVFASCTSLKSITIPNNVTELGNYAFKDCTSLNSVSMSSKAVNWGTGVFYKCSALKNVFIPSGVTEIKANTFYGCKSLVFEDIPSSVTIIGDKAFNGCSSLRDIRFKGNAPKLGTDSFAGVTADCYYPSSNTSWTNSVRSGFGSKLTWYTCKEGGSAGGGTHWVVTSDNALIIYGVGAMPWVNLGEHPWDKYISSLVSFTAKEGVTSISSYTCYYGINVQSIKLPKGLKEIQFGAFEDCRKVTSITLPTSLTTIGELSFVNCSGLKTVTIPASVTKLEAGAFADCSSLTSFKVNTSNKTYVSDSSGVVYTKDKTVIVAVPAALSGTYKILSTVTKINDYAFSGCSKLTSISIPESVTQIGKYGIRRCSGLTSITLPSGLTGIGYSAFATCTGLTTITIPSGVTKLEGNTFHYCTNLAEIKLPSKLKTISRYAFQGCSKLKSIVIPAKVTSVGDSAFYKCSALTVIRFKGNAPTFDKNAFATIKATVKYPSSATGWTKEVRQNYGGTITWLAV